MNTNKNKPYYFLLRLSLLTILLVSCTNQTPSAKPLKKLPAIVEKQQLKVDQDTILRLKYTTGIRSIFEDRNGNFWFGSHQEGVCMFNGINFTYYTIEDGLSDNQVRTIQEDQDGKIWFATGKGVTSFDGKNFKDHSSKNNIALNHLITNKWQNNLNPNDLWFHGDDKAGVFRYNGKDLTFLKFPFPERDPEEPFADLVTGIDKGEFEKIWFATYTGVFAYDGLSFSFINDKTLGLDQKGESERLHIRSVLEDSKGNLWIGNNGIGVLFHDGKTTFNFSEKQGVSIKDKGVNGSLGRVFSMVEDSKGNIWFGTRDNGAWRYDGKELTNYNTDDGLTSVFVNEIYMDKKNELWFGLSDGGVFKFNGESFYRVF